MALAFTKLVRSNYNELDNIPIIHQDLTASFTKQADTYYIHTGSTTSAYTKGRMYYCDGTNLKKVVIVDELPPAPNDGKLTITVNGTAHTFTANQAGDTSFSITDSDTGATSVGVTGAGNAVTTASYDPQTRKLTLTKGTDFMPKSGGTFTGEVKFGGTENFQGYYIKRMLGSLGIGTAYNNLDSSYKDGTYHRMWRLRFPSGSSFWGKIKVTLYGDYSSFNASGLMSKSITCNFNTSNIYNNVGCYDGLGVNVEQDFRISEAIWNATASAWEILIWQQHLNGNNPATIMLECWTKNNTNYIKAFNGIAAQAVELTQSTSYSAQKASPTGGTKTVEWATLPVYENPLGEEIATVTMLKDPNTHYTNYLQIKGNNTEAVKFIQNADKTLNFKPGANVSISAVAGEITINSTDTNTSHSHSAGVGLVGSGNAGTGNGTYSYKAKLRSETALTVDSVASPTAFERVYPVAIDKSGYLAVNVPWSIVTYKAGTGLELSGTTFSAKLNSTTSLGTIGTTSKLYAVGVDANGKLCVNVPWTDTNTTYSAGAGLKLSNGVFSVSTGYATNGRNYGIEADVNGHLYVKVPWTDTNTDTGATNVAVTGNGNAITNASYDSSSRKITFTKGTTFLTSHQTLPIKSASLSSDKTTLTLTL